MIRTEIRALNEDSLDDFLGFMDQDAFADNPMWASCYCLYHYFDGTGDEWAVRSATQNRSEMAARTKAGRVYGLLAYVGNRPVGWCNAAPLTALVAMDPPGPGVAPSEAGAIACFIVAPSARRQGIARQLLDAACVDFRRRGLKAAMAYPPMTPGSDAECYHGPLSLYLEAGFTVLREQDGYSVVQKLL